MIVTTLIGNVKGMRAQALLVDPVLPSVDFGLLWGGIPKEKAEPSRVLFTNIIAIIIISSSTTNMSMSLLS